MLEEFKESLPNWIAKGAKHIGSFENYLGGTKNQIVRLWEFDDFSKWAQFMEWRNKGMYTSEQTPEQAKSLMKIRGYVENIEETVWFSLY